METSEVTDKWIDIVFDGPPSHESGRFVEVENEKRAGTRFGEWVERDDGYWCLRIAPEPEILRLRQRIEDLESEQQRHGDMRPSERIRALEGALKVAKREAYEWEAEATKMREALENLENDDGSIPDHAWLMVCQATGRPFTGKENTA